MKRHINDRRTVGSYVLYPGTDARPKYQDNGNDRNIYRRYHEIIPGIGAFALKPKVANGNHDALDDLFAVVTDKYPVSPGHCLIIARRPVTHFQELTSAEKARLLYWIDWTQQHLTTALTPTSRAYNFGLNDGPAAGQDMPQFHFHIIPRYTGDVADPRGGVRNIIPLKARYW